jgi:hypothetical protein
VQEAREHLARHEIALVAEQVFEELELAGGQLEQPFAANSPPRDQIELEVCCLRSKHFRRMSAPQQSANPGEEFGQGNGLVR